MNIFPYFRQVATGERHGRSASWLAAVALLAAIIVPSISYAAESSPMGLWYVEGGAARVEVYECTGNLCGRIVWLRSPFDEFGCELLDRNNSEPALRARKVEGLEILAALEKSDADNVWQGGSIYDPDSGRTYQCTLTLEGADRLALRGYIGIPLIGRTTRWLRVGTEEATCHANR